MMDRLLTAGLCGNTIGQDIQTLTYHSTFGCPVSMDDLHEIESVQHCA